MNAKIISRKIIKILAVAGLLLIVVLWILSYSVASLFNYVMARQHILAGTVTVKQISASLTGKVEFSELYWKDYGGHTLVYVPHGSFRVRLYDVLTDNFKSTTVQELTLDEPQISLAFDEKMKIDFVGHSRDFAAMDEMVRGNDKNWTNKVSRVGKTEEQLLEEGRKKRRVQQLKIEEGWQNFNRENKKLRLKLAVNRCRLEIFFRDRHYLLSSVNLDGNIDTAGMTELKAYTGIFGGTMIGRGMSIRGAIDFAPKNVPECDLNISLFDVDPSSLGLGLNIHDKMTLTARFSGDVSHPVGAGMVNMKELHIPGLDFFDVEGKIRYEEAMLYFDNVKAKVYGGSLAADGEYNMDSRYYTIKGRGEKLKTRRALQGSHLHCEVDMDITLKSKGNAKNTVAFGSFVSGKGRYGIIPFDKISGSFNNAYRDLTFSDVAIDIGKYKIVTDAFNIKEGKLKLNPIHLVDEQGRSILRYTRESGLNHGVEGDLHHVGE